MGICLVFFSLARIAFDFDGSGLLAICLYFLLSIVFGIFMVRRFSGTPGQLLCSIHIKDINTLENITLVQATIRYVLSKAPVLFVLNYILVILIMSGFSNEYIPEWWFLLLPKLIFIAIAITIILIFMFAIFDQRKQTFYDRIAKVVVIDYKPS
ncbi:MAG: RDD family protein [Wolbachia sp.]